MFVIYRETLAHAFKKWRAELSQVTPQMRARQVVVRTGNRILIAYRQQLADALNEPRVKQLLTKAGNRILTAYKNYLADAL
jgi:hypothetical protein